MSEAVQNVYAVYVYSDVHNDGPEEAFREIYNGAVYSSMEKALAALDDARKVTGLTSYVSGEIPYIMEDELEDEDGERVSSWLTIETLRVL